jgi:NADH dehydrogenase [ubiquinone] 1 alpha subcomplex assembly factor 3
VGDVQVEGSIVCLGDLWLTWSARSLTDITLESLALLELTKPPPDLLVLGCGARIVPPPVALMAALRRRGVAIEALDTVNAVSTYNILNQEGRKVLGAMLPAGVED